MPLPPALLAKLAKRGLVNNSKDKEAPEETFAEDYSENDINPENYEYQSKKRDENVWRSKVKQRFKENSVGVKGCPNKWNLHHVCTVFCLERWGEGLPKPTKTYRERFLRLLDRYPLPKNWVSVWDAGCEAYYFWNKTDDFVSWLPPKHPKAVFGKSAASQRMEKDRLDTDPMMDDEPLMPPPPLIRTRSPPPQMEDRYRQAPVQKKNKSRDLEKILRTKKGRKQFHETSDKLDPMDPAAYSDCGRGKWSSGLAEEAKTGVDSTATGQLFQQRPYPSPGDVLRANQSSRRKNSDDEDEGAKRRRYSDED